MECRDGEKAETSPSPNLTLFQYDINTSFVLVPLPSLSMLTGPDATMAWVHAFPLPGMFFLPIHTSNLFNFLPKPFSEPYS